MAATNSPAPWKKQPCARSGSQAPSLRSKGLCAQGAPPAPVLRMEPCTRPGWWLGDRKDLHVAVGWPWVGVQALVLKALSLPESVRLLPQGQVGPPGDVSFK